jgi:DNA-binding response OmpR family regulator
MKILCVDDSETILLLLERRLERAGYQVRTALGGREALELIDTERFDCVLLDMMMPGVSGLDVIRELRRRGDQVPVIVTSAHRSYEELSEAISAGADERVEKPIDWEELFAKIDRLASSTV